MAVTLSDVARRAGVSEATASRVLNGRRYVAAGTRLRVETAARDLDYVPNRAARDLSMARTSTVAVLLHHAQYPAHGEGTFSSRIVDAVSRALRRRGYDMLYVAVDDAAASRLAGLPAVRPSRSDGALVLGPAFPPEAVAALHAAGPAVVTIDNRLPGIDTVLADNRPAMEALTRHLTDDHGYTRLGCLAGPARWPSTAERVAGIRRQARRAGARLDVIHAGETTMRDGAEHIDRLLPNRPQAVMAVTDALAIGAMHRLRTVAPTLRPAMTGFDDIAWSRLTDPPLTTVAVDATAMGEAAAELLLTRIETADDADLPAREVRVPATVVLRRSCGCNEGAHSPSNRAERERTARAYEPV
jgi:LacI family transcriptional regulator